MAKMMMKKKDRRLFEKINKGKSRKKHYVERMENKRKRIEEEESSKQPQKKTKSKSN